MTVVYVDSVFVLNALMDYFLLLATAHLAGVSPRRGRYILAACLGGAYAVAVFLPGLSWLASPLMKLLAGLAMALAAYGMRERFLRLALLLFLISCGFAGCVLGLGMASGGVPMENGVFYTDVDVRVLLMAAGAAYIVLSVVFRASARHGVRGELVPATVCWEGRELRLTALRDTGNDLRDNATGRPILVVYGPDLAPLWPPELRAALTEEALRAPASAMLRLAPWPGRFRLTNYTAVGTSGGLLLTARLDWGIVDGQRYERLLAALSPTPLGDGFNALWGGGERRNRNGYAEKTVGKHQGPGLASGTDPGPGAPLHRGQRHPAAAPQPGAGGGAGGADRRGGRQAGADRAQPPAGGVHRPPV